MPHTVQATIEGEVSPVRSTRRVTTHTRCVQLRMFLFLAFQVQAVPESVVARVHQRERAIQAPTSDVLLPARVASVEQHFVMIKQR